MARPGFVLEVDERTPQLLVHDGRRLRTEQFPLGTEVVYPPESLNPVDDLNEAIDDALARPLDSDPLADRLRAGMKLTVVFDDLTVPGTRLRAPDVRGRIVERVLIAAADAGVDDVTLIAAIGLNRRNTEAELRHLLGERVFRSFYADGRLLQHDAEDIGALTELAGAEGDEAPVAVNARVAESDLVVVVHLVDGPNGGGLSVLSQGVGSRATIGAELGLAGVRAGATAAERAATAIGTSVGVFQIEAVLDNAAYGPRLEFLGRREWEWGLAAQATFAALRRGLSVAPGRAARRLVTGTEAAYHVTQVRAGDPTAVRRASRERIETQQRVEVTGQADVLVLGVDDLTPYSIDSVTNPVLAGWSALGDGFNAVTGAPMVREGGAVIIYHPLGADFSPLHHPSYVDFFSSVLSVTTDADAMAADFETKFAEDPWWRHLYQTSQAFHGVHPFHRWYAMAGALTHCGDVVVVGGDRASAARLGFRAATTLADALEIVAAGVGHNPKIRYLHRPPHVLADVR